MRRLVKPGCDDVSDDSASHDAVFVSDAPDPVTSVAAGTSALSSRQIPAARRLPCRCRRRSASCRSSPSRSNIARSRKRASPTIAKTGLNDASLFSSDGADRWIALFQAVA